MARSVIVATHMLTHRQIMRTIMVGSTIGADRMVVVEPIAMIPIEMMGNAMVRMPPTRPIPPVVWRVPCYPR